MQVAQAHRQHAEQRDHDGGAGKQHRPACGRHRRDRCLAWRHAAAQRLAVAGDDEQRVVDADAETDHGGDSGGPVGRLEHTGRDAAEHGADAEAEQSGEDRQPHGQRRTKGEQQNDRGEDQPDGLRADFSWATSVVTSTSSPWVCPG